MTVVIFDPNRTLFDAVCALDNAREAMDDLERVFRNITELINAGDMAEASEIAEACADNLHGMSVYFGTHFEEAFPLVEKTASQ